MKALKYSEIRLTNGLFKERETVNRNYLLSLDNRALLQNFYLEAGIILPGLQIIPNPEDCYLHWGWEAPSCQLRGHFLGHWLSAASHLVETNKDRELEAKLYTIIDELKICQEKNGGKWIGSVPEKYFKRLETNEYIWSPQYTVHKTLMGLLDTYVCTGYQTAFDILDNAADWYIDWIDSLTEHPEAVLKGEAGGMLEIWASLYDITKNDKYLKLANAYYYKDFDMYLAGEDVLTDNHANASIPMAHGAARMYEVTKDEKWLTITKEFWKQAILDREAYATGGQNAGEFWIAPNHFFSAISDRTQEFCTMYNMVRLAEYLYRFTGDKSYSDYIELLLYNGFLSQQNKFTGMPTYFLPMRPGSRKLWGSKTRDFWCCTGTMVQAQTLYPSLIAFKDETSNTVSIEQYINSDIDLVLNDNKVSIKLTTNMDYCQGSLFGDGRDNNIKTRWSFTANISSTDELVVKFRIPKWAKKVYVDEIEIANPEDYYTITGKYDNDKVNIFFLSELETKGLSDNENATAILDGPIVLAGIDEEGRNFSLNGNSPKEMLIPFVEHTYDSYPWQQNSYRSSKDNGKTLFLPLYAVTDEMYTIYVTK